MGSSERCDLLLTHAHLLTLAPVLADGSDTEGVGYIEDGAVAITNDSIAAVGTTLELLTAGYGDSVETIDCAGMVDAHMHTNYASVRGVAQDVANWMQKGLAPYSKHQKAAGAPVARAGTRLAILEALKAGTTTFGDYLEAYDGWAESFIDAGVRAVLTPNINALPAQEVAAIAFRVVVTVRRWLPRDASGMAGLELGELYPFDEERGAEQLAKAVAFCESWSGAGDGRVSCMLGPQGIDMLPEGLIRQCWAEAKAHGWMIHLHLAQGDREINQMIKRYGMRTPEWMAKRCLLGPELLAVHLTEATPNEAAMIAQSGARMAVCNGSIGIIDGIVCPAEEFQAAGGKVALGSDQSPGNNCHNLFNEMKLTSLFNKVKNRDPTAMPCWKSLRMATVEGAEAIGLGERIGSIEAGKLADILILTATPSISPILTSPIRNLVPNLVYSARGDEVDTVIVNGRIIMRERKVLTMDEEAILREAQSAGELVASMVAGDPDHEKMQLLQAMNDAKL